MCSHQVGEIEPLAHELVVGTNFRNLALLQHHDLVSLGKILQRVGNQQPCALAEHPGRSEDLLEERGSDVVIHGGERIVEKVDIRGGVNGPGDGHTLLLPAGEGHAPFADHGHVARGEDLQVGFELGDAEALSVLFLVVRLAKEDVVLDGGVEDPSLLGDVRDAPAHFHVAVVCGTNLLSAESSVDLPQPTLPMTMVSEPGARSRSTPVNSNGGCSGSSAGTSTASGGVVALLLLLLLVILLLRLDALAGGPFLGSSGFFCTAGHLKSPAATRTRPGSDMSGSTFSFSSWSKKAPRRCTALSALSKLVSKNGTRMRGSGAC